jgi:hypothetical protein
MAKHNKNKNLSGYSFDGKPMNQPELLIRECFLRMAKDALDSFGIETYSIEQIRGGVTMLEKYKEIIEE